jgi:GMP synthase (glutamine-hydrolysing)
MKPRILIADYSSDSSEAAAVRRWLPPEVNADHVYVPFADSLPDVGGYDGLVHTGSSYSICDEAPFDGWAEDAVRTAARAGIPQMGVCYGHQMICRALLGRRAVRRCPSGLEAGWLQVSFFGGPAEEIGLPPTARVFQSHLDEVVRIPEGSAVFAESPHTRIQAYLCHSPWILGLQFHPEFDREAGNRTFMGDPDLLRRNGMDPDEVVSSGPTMDAGTIFLGYYARYTVRHTATD